MFFMVLKKYCMGNASSNKNVENIVQESTVSALIQSISQGDETQNVKQTINIDHVTNAILTDIHFKSSLVSNVRNISSRTFDDNLLANAANKTTSTLSTKMSGIGVNIGIQELRKKIHSVMSNKLEFKTLQKLALHMNTEQSFNATNVGNLIASDIHYDSFENSVRSALNRDVMASGLTSEITSFLTANNVTANAGGLDAVKSIAGDFKNVVIAFVIAVALILLGVLALLAE